MLIIITVSKAFTLHNTDNLEALVGQALLDLALVLSKGTSEFLVLWVLLNCANGPNSTSVSTDKVLESN